MLCFSVDVTNHRYDFTLGFDHLRLEGKYDVDGKIIMIMVKGTGNMEADVCKFYLLEMNICISMKNLYRPSDTTHSVLGIAAILMLS